MLFRSVASRYEVAVSEDGREWRAVAGDKDRIPHGQAAAPMQDAAALSPNERAEADALAVEVAEEPEPGDVRGASDPRLPHRGGSLGVRRRHRREQCSSGMGRAIVLARRAVPFTGSDESPFLASEKTSPAARCSPVYKCVEATPGSCEAVTGAAAAFSPARDASSAACWACSLA